MNILNFSHPLTDVQRAQIAAAVGEPIDQVVDLATQFDPAAPFVPQVVALLDNAAIAPARLQTEVWLVMPPALNIISAIVLAELHGRMGHFPAIIRLRPVANAVAPTFEFAEIINLDQVRQAARQRR